MTAAWSKVKLIIIYLENFADAFVALSPSWTWAFFVSITRESRLGEEPNAGGGWMLHGKDSISVASSNINQKAARKLK